MYADYGYYRDHYLGDRIAEEEFPRLSARASEWLDSVSRVGGHTEEDAVKRAACAVAEAWQASEEGGEVVSQSVGSWSKTYAAGEKRTRDQALMDAARMYLVPAGLMRAVSWV